MRLVVTAVALATVFAMQTAHAGEGQRWFAVVLQHNTPAMTEEAMGKAMMGHLDYMNDLYDQGIMFMGGPYLDETGQGLGIVMAESEEQIRASLAEDPAAKAGIFTVVSIHPWWPGFNRPFGERMTGEQMQKMMMSGQAPDNMVHGEMAGGGGSSEGGMMDSTPGRVGFIELGSLDLAGTEAFYSGLFGWKFESMPEMDGTMSFWTDPKGMGGGFNTMLTPSLNGPVLYIDCEGIAATLARVEAAGGQTVMPGMALPGEGWGYIAQFTDPSGNKLGLWSSNP